MRSMRIDCAPVRIETWPELEAYMDGSAGSVGRIMAPLLGVPARHHAGYGRLGQAFQLANFIRDVREDTALDRVYLPAEDRARFGVAEDELRGAAGVARAARAARAGGPARARRCSPRPSRRSPRRPPPYGRASASPSRVYQRVLDRVERIDFDVLGRRTGVRAVAAAGRGAGGAAPVTRRATLRGAERVPLDGDAARADVLICGASFAGLAVARELAGTGADVLVVDRYEIGERQTSACAAPTPWLRGDGRARRDPAGAAVHGVPHAARLGALPAALELVGVRLPDAVPGAVGAVRRAVRDREGRGARRRDVVRTDRGALHAPLIVDALGWRRVLGPGPNVQPPDALISRGLEVHPDARGGDTDLDIWIDRSLIRQGYAWSVPAGEEQRVGVGSYEPRDHVKAPTLEIAGRLGVTPVRYQGNWFPHALRPAAEDGVFFVGDSAGHCFPLSGEGIRTAFYFGIACGRELRRVLAGEATRGEALRAYGAFSAATRRRSRSRCGCSG